MLFLYNIAHIAQRTFMIIQKSRSHEHGDIIISTRMYVYCGVCESQDFHVRGTADISRKLQLILFVIMAS